MKMSALKKLAAGQIRSYHETMGRIGKLREKSLAAKQAACPHAVLATESGAGYFEEGRMRAPPPDTVYQVCVACKKKISILTPGTPKFVPFDGR